MRPHKSFFGLTLDGFKSKAKPCLDALAEIEALDAQCAHTFVYVPALFSIVVVGG